MNSEVQKPNYYILQVRENVLSFLGKGSKLKGLVLGPAEIRNFMLIQKK